MKRQSKESFKDMTLRSKSIKDAKTKRKKMPWENKWLIKLKLKEDLPSLPTKTSLDTNFWSHPGHSYSGLNGA
jgi:hypothetical protein